MRFLAMLLPLLAGCGPGQPDFRPAPAKEPLRIESALTVEEATTAVHRAAADSGFVVTRADPGVITVGPYQLPDHAAVVVTLRANIVPTDNGSLILVSGTGLDADLPPAVVRPIAHSTQGRYGWQFAELTRFVHAIQARTETAP